MGVSFREKYRVVRVEVQKSVELTPEQKQYYARVLRELQKEVKMRVKSLKDAKFLGRYANYIRKELKEEFQRLGGTTMMIHILRSLDPSVSTRGTHIYNAAEIAYKIALGIFKDEEIARGVALATLCHDMGQPAFGHDGENISSKASARKQGGPRPHNATGAQQILFRKARRIKEAIDRGIRDEMIEEEATERGIPVEELVKSFEEGNELELQKAIEERILAEAENKEAALKMLVTAAGRHNGERGTADIIPQYKRTFEDFFDVLRRCYIYNGADKEMQSAQMIDAIVKISDQISSIPFDIIDGKRGGVSLDIPNDYVEPIAKILDIEEKEVEKLLLGNNNELILLVRRIQDKLIESLIESSNKRGIHMGLAPLMYGKKDKTGQTLVKGLRMPTYELYLPYTSAEEEVRILQKSWYESMEKLSSKILDKNGVFPNELNAIFRMSEDDPRRKTLVKSLKQKYGTEKEYLDFIDFILETTPEEYNFIKNNLHEHAVNLMREKIKSAKEKFAEDKSKFMSGEGSDEIEQGILNYMHTSSRGIPEPVDGKEYTDEEITEIYKYINSTRQMQGKKPLLLQRDQRIAAQLALEYIEGRFDDKGFVNFCVSIGTMTEEEKKVVMETYNPIIKEAYLPDNVKAAGAAYREAEEDEQGI